MWLLLLLLLIVTLLSVNIEPFQNRIIPFHTPFDTKFHHYQEPIITIDSSNMTDRLLYITKDLQSRSTAIDADIKLVPELNILTDDKYNFIATLHHPSLLLLTRNQTGILDFDDIRHYSCRVRIGVPSIKSPEYHLISDIINYYPKGVKDNIDIIKLSTDSKSVLGHDYHIHAQLIYPGHPNAIIKLLTQQQPSHLVTMTRINSGSYFVTRREKTFYNKHPYYGKTLYDLQKGLSQYPQLSRIGNQQYSLYLPTINCRYILVSKPSVPDESINKIIKNLFNLYTSRKIKDMTITDISRNVTKLKIHNAAAKIYTKLNLIVDHKNSIYEGI